MIITFQEVEQYVKQLINEYNLNDSLKVDIVLNEHYQNKGKYLCVCLIKQPENYKYSLIDLKSDRKKEFKPYVKKEFLMFLKLRYTEDEIINMNRWKKLDETLNDKRPNILK
jgi:hypothetical protein